MCEITTFNLPKWSRFESDLQKVGQGHELQRRRICRWVAFCGLQDGDKIADLSQADFNWSTNKAYTNAHARACTRAHMRTCTQTHTQLDDSNRRECNALHFA